MNTNVTSNKHVNAWIAEMADLVKPSNIILIDGSKEQTEALRAGNLEEFFGGVFASGNSSFKYLQNVYTTKNVAEQGLSLALCVTEYITSGWGGAFRVHGGGFAGTIQAFIPTEKVEEY